MITLYHVGFSPNNITGWRAMTLMEAFVEAKTKAFITDLVFGFPHGVNCLLATRRRIDAL